MTSRKAPSTAVRQLIDFLLDGAQADAPGDALAVELADWLARSSGFRSFATAYREKIRKKLRGAPDAETRLDLRAELRVAERLLADDRMELMFEASGSARGGPDFAITYRGRSLNLEVTRLRRTPEPVSVGRALLAKLRQLPPGMPNVLLLAARAAPTDPHAIDAAVKALRARADARDDAFFARHGLLGGRGFYDRFLRLGAVLVWAEPAAGDDRARLWVNPSARIEPPARALRAIVACLEGD